MFSSVRSAAPTLRRAYAAAPKVSAPVALQTLPGKYATAAFTSALTKSAATLSQVESDLTTLAKLIENKDKAAAFLENPTLGSSERAAAIKGLASKIPKINETTLGLLDVLSANGRLTTTSEVIKDFIVLSKAQKGEVEIIVTSAEPLEKSVSDRLERALKGSETAKGKTVKVVNKVNPELLAGIVVDFGDKTIDLSAASKVNKLNGLLTQSV
ncbi:OSCP/delta subunit of ATPase [Mrakia frigida]|uniref:F1F0 ATP synthase subunit 5 n=1 Tax=Mrakia frigida TaxID=29902 RepID=UPI003FCC1BE9